MKPRTPGPWLIAAIIGLLSQMPTSAFAGMTPEEVKAFEGYKAKAEKGNAEAQYNLGESYDNGDGVPKDKVEGVKWYRKAAEQGNAVAQSNLGFMYANGDGAPELPNIEHQTINIELTRTLTPCPSPRPSPAGRGKQPPVSLLKLTGG